MKDQNIQNLIFENENVENEYDSYYRNNIQPRTKDFIEYKLINQTILVKLVKHQENMLIDITYKT